MNFSDHLHHWMHDSTITDICINPDGRAFLDRGFGLEVAPLNDESFAKEAIKGWVLERLSQAGKSWDARHPFVDAQILPAHRLHAVFPPVGGGGLAVSLRRLGRALPGPAEVRWKKSESAFARLRTAVQAGESVLISGSTGSGKTTLLNDLLEFVPESERLLALEDTPELAPRHPHFVALEARPPNADGFGEITIRSLLRQSLRMRPDRILLGECRGAEVLDLLQVLNTGHRGSLATIHANSARDALRRLEILALLSAPEGLSTVVLREWIASGIQWIAQVRRTNGERVIAELARVEGIEAGTLLLRRVDSGTASML